jgi:dTDP-4-amino-4,6-dideoxygalactose transaminase
MRRLAINGGTPVRTRPFPRWPVWDDAEKQALIEVLESGQWGAYGQETSRVAQFEQAFARAHHARLGYCVTTGTAALETALRAIEVDYGDEVIVPPYTFIATASACLLVGALPVFADIDPQTYTLDPAQVEQAITPRTRAIIPVHIGGCPADMDGILAVARRHGLRVIEDACQAHTAAWDGQRVGSIGDLGCFSFQASKNINAGEGGIVLTSDEVLGVRCWSYRNCGRIPAGHWYQHEMLGTNHRMTEWQGAVLLAQLGRMEELARRREENGRYLAQALAEIGGFEPQARPPKVTQHAYHLFIARYHAETFGGLPRAAFLNALQAEGIPCSKGYVPLYDLPAIRHERRRLMRFVRGSTVTDEQPHCPVTHRACAEESVWFSQAVLLGERRDMDDIVEAITRIRRHADQVPR